MQPTGSKGPQPNKPASTTDGVTEETSLRAIPLKAEYLGPAEPAQGSLTRKVQHPLYFVSSVLRDTRERYPMMQKLLLAILIASRKMRPYFESHPITVVSQYNLRSPLENPLATGRISLWVMELQGFGLRFEHTNNIKSQALADFMAEWTEMEFDGPVEESCLPEKEDPNAWIMNFDGCFSKNKGGARVVLDSPTADRLKYVVQVV